jgi:ribonuclease HI
MDSGTGYGVIGYYLGHIIFRTSVPFAKHASNYDAKMFALAHAASWIKREVTSSPLIKKICIFSDASSTIEKIFEGSPHPSKLASILFRDTFFELFTRRPDIKCRVSWTPGHGGTMGMKKVDKLAKKGASSSNQPLLDFSSRSAALSTLESDTLKRWKQHIDDHPFSSESGSAQASLVLHPHLRPPKWSKTTSHPIMSRLTKFVTGHAYTGEYYKKFNICEKFFCICSPPGAPPVFHSRNHVFKECPLYDEARSVLEETAHRVSNPR